MMKVVWKILSWSGGAVVLWLMIIALIYLFCPGEAKAEPITELSCPADTVSYTDAVDLIRKVDAVVAVTDTSYRKKWYGYSCNRSDFDELMLYHRWFGDSVKVISKWHYMVLDSITTIRHRRLVRVMVMSKPTREPTGVIIATFPTQVEMRTIPGTAIVWFEWEVK